MRRLFTVLTVIVAGVVTGGFASAIAASGIAQEQTIVLGEHTIKGRFLDLAGKADDLRPGDRYVFRSRLTDDSGPAGFLYADCSVHFAGRDTCSQVYDIAGRGTVTVHGIVPVSELEPDGTWTLAITGGTGEFENAGGSVAVAVVSVEGDTQHTLHLLP